MNANTVRITTERIKVRGRANVQLVRRNGVAIGYIEKLPNTRTEAHPWKAFVGVGMDARFIQAFYPEDGGQGAALATVAAFA